MKPQLILILAVFAAAGCASSPSGGLPICDGKHLRPANPNGSVLNPATPATSSTAPTPAAPVAGQPGCDA